jgi:FemAB-related protein (PEP-CTERM system-associated)
MTTSFASELPVHVGPRQLVHEPRVDPVDSAADWDAYVRGHPSATMYHLYAWKTVAERAYGMKAPFLVARDRPGGPIRGVLPLVRVPRPFASYLTTGIFGSYGPLLADDAYYGRALLDAARRLVDEGAASFLHLKVLGSLPESAGYERRDVWVTALLDVGSSPAELWKRLRPPMRTKIRQAERAGLTVEYGAAGLDAYYDVLSENMLRKGSPIYGKRFMRVLLDALGPQGDVALLRHEGRVVSGALIAWFNGTMLVPFVSSRPSSFHLRPNNLLYWELAKRAQELGLHTLDFGSSMRDSSGLQFKESWRPRIEPIGSYVYTPRGTVPDLAPVGSPLTRYVVSAWSHLPPRVAEALGPVLCRWIA